MTDDKASRSGWSVVLPGAGALACCLAGPALAGLLGGTLLWGIGLQAALAIAVVHAGACYALVAALRRRGRSSP